MLSRSEIPLKTAGMIEACDKDLDLWGNGERRLYHYLTPSLVNFLLANTTIFKHQPVLWCDIGCGAGWFLEGLVAACDARDLLIIPMGVDVVPKCIDRCRQVWRGGKFSVCDLNEYRRSPAIFMPWAFADVVGFVEVFQMLKNYRKSVHDIWPEIRSGAVVVVADGIGYPYLRDYLKSMPGCTFLGGWVDHTMPVTPRDPQNPLSKNTHLKYRVYRKDPE